MGTGLIFTIWLPLALLALPLGPRLAQALFQLPQDLRISELLLQLQGSKGAAFAVTLASPSVLAFALAAAFGGAILQRQGAAGAQAAASGTGAGFLSWSLAALGNALTPWFVAAAVLVFLTALGAGSAACGATITRFFVRRRGISGAGRAPRT